MSALRWQKLRHLTGAAVKQGAAVFGSSVTADTQLGRLLRKLGDEPPAPPRPRPARVHAPAGRADAAPRWSEEGAWARTGGARGPDAPRAAAVGSPPAAAPISAAHGAFAALAVALPAAGDPAGAREPAVGDVIGERYEIRRAVGRGPAYRVFVAQHRIWGGEVALKLPRHDGGLGAPPRDLVADALRWTGLGLHPHVVYCHYVDHLDAQPLLVVEYRAGGNLRPWIAAGRTANLRIGLNLAVQICHGLECAHAEGVWHGGLRPENLLFDADGTLAVGDFGIAAAPAALRVDANGAAAARTRELAPYLAPEQWVDPAGLDARSDLFALGVCLYEMFTGRRPFESARGPRRAAPEPAVALPPRLAALLRRCVDWDAAARPLSARSVREELCAVHRELYRRASPFESLPARSWEADGWNNQAAALVLLGHPETADAAWEQALAADPTHLEATYNAGMARWGRAELSDVALLEQVAGAAARAPDEAAGALLLAELELRSGDLAAARARLEALDADVLDAAGRALLERSRRERDGAGLTASWTGHRGYVAGVQLLDGGARALSASDDGTLAIWAPGHATPLRVLEGHRGAVACVILAGDGRHAVSGGDDGVLRVWELKTGRCIRTVTASGRILGIGVSAELGRAVVTCTGTDNFVGVDNTTMLAFDLERQRPLGTLSGHTAAAKGVAVSADGRLAVSGSDDHTVRVWDLAQGGGCRRVMEGHTHYVSAVALSPDGSIAVSGGWDTTIRVWDTHSGRCLRVLRGHEGIVNGLALSADGAVVVSGGWDRTVRAWEVATGRCLRSFAAHDGIVSGVAVSADGRTAASASWDKSVRLWRLPARTDGAAPPRLSRRVCYARLPSGEPEPDELLDDAEVAMAEGRRGDALAALRAARPRATGADALRGAALWRRLTPHCRPRGVRALATQAEWIAVQPLAAVWAGAAAGWVVEALRSGVLRLWDAELERVQRTLAGHEARVVASALSADRQLLASAAADRSVRLWDLHDGSCRAVLCGHTSVVAAVALAADGRYALSGGHDHEVRLWDLHGKACAHVFAGHERQVTGVAFDAAHGRVLSADRGGVVRICDAGDGACAHVLAAHQGAVTVLRPSAGGAHLLSAGADGALRLWDLASGACLVHGAGEGGAILAADVSADGDWALAAARDGQASLWHLPTAGRTATFRLAGVPLVSASVDLAAGRVAALGCDNRVRLFEVEWELAEQP